MRVRERPRPASTDSASSSSPRPARARASSSRGSGSPGIRSAAWRKCVSRGAKVGLAAVEHRDEQMKAGIVGRFRHGRLARADCPDQIACLGQVHRLSRPGRDRRQAPCSFISLRCRKWLGIAAGAPSRRANDCPRGATNVAFRAVFGSRAEH